MEGAPKIWSWCHMAASLSPISAEPRAHSHGFLQVAAGGCRWPPVSCRPVEVRPTGGVSKSTRAASVTTSATLSAGTKLTTQPSHTITRLTPFNLANPARHSHKAPYNHTRGRTLYGCAHPPAGTEQVCRPWCVRRHTIISALRIEEILQEL